MAEGKEAPKLPGVIVGFDRKTGENFTFFFGRDTVFSQWHSASFKVDGVEYGCAEQYMMHQKAGQEKPSTRLNRPFFSLCVCIVCKQCCLRTKR